MIRIYEKMGIKWNNEYYDNGDHVILRISKVETNESYDVLIDYCDLEKVKLGQWFVLNKRKKSKFKDIYSIIWSKIINGKQFNYDIHQYILDTKLNNKTIDHINGNRFDNRRVNIRVVNSSENSRNQIHKGYNYDKPTNKYLVRISIDGKAVNIGRYNTELEAETMYLKAHILLGYFSNYHNERIKELNIKLNKEDYENKYIQKICNIIGREYNGK